MRVKIQTMLGDIVVRLYDETPIHRDNFVKLERIRVRFSDPLLVDTTDVIHSFH